MEKKGGDTLSKQRRQISRDKKAWKTMLSLGTGEQAGSVRPLAHMWDKKVKRFSCRPG